MFKAQRAGRLALFCVLGAMAVSSSTASTAQAQTYPQKRINLVVAYAAGGFADTFARLIGQELTKRWNITAIVENRAGAGGNLAADFVGNAPADGSTVLVTTTGIAINETLVINRASTLAKLVPVAVSVSSPEALAVHPSRPRDLRGFLDAMAGKGITFATAGPGSGSHIAAEYFLKILAKAKPVHVPFRGGAPSVQAALGNQVDMVAASFGIVPQAVEGQLYGLAVASPSRLEAMPDVPTFTELGFPFEAESWVGLFVPRTTPPEVIAMLNAAVNDIVGNDELRQKLISQGYLRHRRDVPQAQAYVAAEVEKWRTMIKAVGVTAE